MRRRGSRYQPITGGAEMFARLQTVAARPTDEELVPMIADMVSGHPGFAGLARLAAVLRTVPGLVRMLVLWHPTERRMAVLHLATSIAALEAVSEAVMSTKLLPGEDPALLPGPDRITLLRVAAYRAAVPAPK